MVQTSLSTQQAFTISVSQVSETRRPFVRPGSKTRECWCLKMSMAAHICSCSLLTGTCLREAALQQYAIAGRCYTLMLQPPRTKKPLHNLKNFNSFG
jgi:hypothetical protein